MEKFLLSQKIVGFEEKEAQRQKKDGSVDGGTEENFLQKGSDLSAGGTNNALCSLPCAEEIAKKEACSDNQKNFDGKALYQFFGWHHDDPSEGEAQKNIRENCQIREPIGGDIGSYQ